MAVQWPIRRNNLLDKLNRQNEVCYDSISVINIFHFRPYIWLLPRIFFINYSTSFILVNAIFMFFSLLCSYVGLFHSNRPSFTHTHTHDWFKPFHSFLIEIKRENGEKIIHLLQMALHLGYITNYLYHIHFEQVLIFEHKFRCFCNDPE
jgi:hypothetical protein